MQKTIQPSSTPSPPITIPFDENVNQIIIYKTIIIPVWSYGGQIWGQAKSSDIRPIQAFQSIRIRQITGTPWYMTNNELQKKLTNSNSKRNSNLTI